MNMMNVITKQSSNFCRNTEEEQAAMKAQERFTKDVTSGLKEGRENFRGGRVGKHFK